MSWQVILALITGGVAVLATLLSLLTERALRAKGRIEVFSRRERLRVPADGEELRLEDVERELRDFEAFDPGADVPSEKLQAAREIEEAGALAVYGVAPPTRVLARIHFWQVIISGCFIAAMVILATSNNASDRQGAWGLLGVVIGAVVPKGT